MATLATAAATGSNVPELTFTLKSNELGGQLTNKKYINGMGFSGEKFFGEEGEMPW